VLGWAVAAPRGLARIGGQQRRQLHACPDPQVLTECGPAIGGYQNALLQEVAKIMAKPRGMSPAASRCKQVSCRPHQLPPASPAGVAAA